MDALEKVFRTLEVQVNLLKSRGLRGEQTDEKILEIEHNIA